MTKERALKIAEKREQWANLAEKKAQVLEDTLINDPRYTDFSTFWLQPSNPGDSLSRQRDKFRKTRSAIRELQEKARIHRQKANNLRTFAGRNKGDAAGARQATRDTNDELVERGTKIYAPLYRREGVISKIFKNSYRIDFGDFQTTMDKSYIQVISS